jgi:uncharacterized YccA/Bax inhibitor family protein
VTNPIFTNNPAFRAPRQGGVRTASTLGTTGAMTADAAALEQMYGAPTATSRDTGRMTYDDVIVKTGGLLALLVAVAGVTWFVAPQLFFVGMIVGLVLGLVNAFKKVPSPGLIIAYAVAQGVFLGGLSYVVQAMVSTPGVAADSIVVQALLATAATFVGALILFRSGKVRVTAKSVRFLLIAMTGYLLFSLVNVALVWFGGMDGWGLRSEVSVMGIPLGILIGLFAVGLAAYSLIVDFDAIKRGVEQGVPARYAWTAAFGLIVTLVWLYVEFLRIFAILRGSN